MKKSDTEQEQPGLEENKVPDSQSKRELDRELQELAENERQEEIYYEERRRERHERNLKRKKRQIRNRNLALIITALAVLGGVGYFYREQTGAFPGAVTAHKTKHFPHSNIQSCFIDRFDSVKRLTAFFDFYHGFSSL